MTLAEFVRHRRRALDLTQAQVAGAMGWDRTTVSQLERGLRGLRAREIGLLAAVLDTDPAFFLDLAQRDDDDET